MTISVNEMQRATGAARKPLAKLRDEMGIAPLDLGAGSRKRGERIRAASMAQTATAPPSAPPRKENEPRNNVTILTKRPTLQPSLREVALLSAYDALTDDEVDDERGAP